MYIIVWFKRLIWDIENISAEENRNHNCLLKVHIVDMSQRIRKGDA